MQVSVWQGMLFSMYSEDLRLTTYRESAAKKDQFIKKKTPNVLYIWRKS
jgi:hypothetical protein